VDFLRNNNDSSFLSLDEIKNTLRIAEQKS
jgi:hypothetical protein